MKLTQQERKKRKKGLVISISVHVVFVLLCLVIFMWTQKKPVAYQPKLALENPTPQTSIVEEPNTSEEMVDPSAPDSSHKEEPPIVHNTKEEPTTATEVNTKSDNPKPKTHQVNNHPLQEISEETLIASSAEPTSEEKIIQPKAKKLDYKPAEDPVARTRDVEITEERGGIKNFGEGTLDVKGWELQCGIKVRAPHPKNGQQVVLKISINDDGSIGMLDIDMMNNTATPRVVENYKKAVRKQLPNCLQRIGKNAKNGNLWFK